MSELTEESRAWLKQQGFVVEKDSIWLEALTHGSMQGSDPEAKHYQRLEFLGDRVLGLSVAHWLYSQGDEPEGKLSQRLNALVSGATCARIARGTGLPKHIRLGKQAREDGGADSEKILGDVVEALLGASFVEHGFDVTQDIVRKLWADELAGASGQAKHPKSALQEWAAGNQRRMPEYTVVDRSGPDHASQFTVCVSVYNVGEATATAASKSAAEKRAAKAFLEQYG